MNFIRWKTLVITAVICLIPIFFGLMLWNELPDTMPIHFNINNEADNFASKELAVLILPVIMFVLQIICCISLDSNTRKHGSDGKAEASAKWIIPIITIALQTAMIAYSLGYAVDMRKIAVFTVGMIFIITGKYLPKLNYIKNYKIDSNKAIKINKFTGYATCVMGVLALITVFLPPITSVIWLCAIVPYAIICAVYGIKIFKAK